MTMHDRHDEDYSGSSTRSSQTKPLRKIVIENKGKTYEVEGHDFIEMPSGSVAIRELTGKGPHNLALLSPDKWESVKFADVEFKLIKDTVRSTPPPAPATIA